MELVQKENKAKKILLITGMMNHWKRMFNPILPFFPEDVSPIFVKLSGSEGHGDFESVEEEAKEIIQAMNQEGLKNIDYALGISLGANILVKMMEMDVQINKVILDAPFLSVFPNFLAEKIAKKSSEQMWSLFQADQKLITKALAHNMRYGKENAEQIVTMLDRKLSKKSLYKQNYATHRQKISSDLSKFKNPVLGLCGEKEKFALKAFQKLKKHLPQLESHIFPEEENGTMILNHPKEYTKIIFGK